MILLWYRIILSIGRSMTFELLFYLFLLILGALLCAIRINDRLYSVATLFIFFCFSVVVRNAGFDADIGNYAEYLKIDSFSIYYIKESVYWLGSRLIFDVIGSELIVFVIYDLLFFILLLLARDKLELPKYFPYLVVLFFPSVMGMQNVFRQFIACGFLLILFVQIINQNKKSSSIIIFLLAGFSHNAAFLFLPILFLKPKSRKISQLFLVASISILIILPVAAGSKSNSVTGEVPAYMFAVLFTLIILGYLAIFNFNFKNRPPIFTQFLYFLFFCYVLMIEGAVVLGAAQSKRLGMLALVLCLIPLVMSIEIRFKQKVLVRLVFLLILTTPTFIFQNAFSLLQTTEESLNIEAISRNQSHKGTQ